MTDEEIEIAELTTENSSLRTLLAISITINQIPDDPALVVLDFAGFKLTLNRQQAVNVLDCLKDTLL